MKAGTVANKKVGKKKVGKYTLEDCKAEIARLEGYGDKCSEYYQHVLGRLNQLSN